MMGTWQDSSHLSPFNPPSFFFLFFSFKFPGFPLFLFHCSFFFVLTHAHAHSLCFPSFSFLPDFHPPSWTPVPGKGPQLIPLLHCSFNFVSYNEHKMNTGGENWDSGQKVEEWAWAASLKGMLSSWLEPLFWGTWMFTMLIMDAVWADIRACEKSSPHLLSLVLGFLTLIAL